MQIERSVYLQQLIDSKDNGLIKIVTGLRRVGKSYLLKTLFKKHLLSEGINKDHILIIDLEDRKYKDFRNKYMGKFPVVFISLKQVDGDDFTGAYDQLGCIVFDMYNSFSCYLAESPKLNDAEKKLFNEIASDASFFHPQYRQ